MLLAMSSRLRKFLELDTYSLSWGGGSHVNPESRANFLSEHPEARGAVNNIRASRRSSSGGSVTPPFSVEGMPQFSTAQESIFEGNWI